MTQSERTHRYTIGELAGLSGISRRTVRFYVQSGLIPPPLGAGRGSYYTNEHLEAIVRIRRRQAEGFGLPRAPEPAGTAPARFDPDTFTSIRLLDGYSLVVGRDHVIPSTEELRRLAAILECRPGSHPRDDEGID
jgi:hypothetical protein